MGKYKIVFKDGDTQKLIFGYPDFKVKDPTLLKVDTDRGNVVYINKESIVFMKELTRGITWLVKHRQILIL